MSKHKKEEKEEALMQVRRTASRLVGEKTEEYCENSMEGRTAAVSPRPTTGDTAGAVGEGRRPPLSINGNMSSGEGETPAKKMRSEEHTSELQSR